MNSHEHSPKTATRRCGSGLPKLDHKAIALLDADGNVVIASDSQVTVYKANDDNWRPILIGHLNTKSPPSPTRARGS